MAECRSLRQESQKQTWVTKFKKQNRTNTQSQGLCAPESFAKDAPPFHVAAPGHENASRQMPSVASQTAEAIRMYGEWTAPQTFRVDLEHRQAQWLLGVLLIRPFRGEVIWHTRSSTAKCLPHRFSRMKSRSLTTSHSLLGEGGIRDRHPCVSRRYGVGTHAGVSLNISHRF